MNAYEYPTPILIACSIPLIFVLGQIVCLKLFELWDWLRNE